MKKHLTLFLGASLLSLTAFAQFATAPAFPGAEGFGRFTTGGRGGKVYHVTNLNDSGTGSLRDAVNASGPRIVVFDVSGTIKLESTLTIRNGNISILGQTAPGDGICLRDHCLSIASSNVILRYVRCRLGDVSNTEDDALTASHHDNAICNNIIVDHCSVSWSVDECASFYGNKDFTFQWSIISESLKNSVHDKGNHGYGGIWGGQNAAFHHNLLAHHDSRNPRFDHDYVSTLHGPIDYVNNVLYNWGGNSAYGGESQQGSSARHINMQGNYYKPGPATRNTECFLNPTSNCGNCPGTDVAGIFYIEGNYLKGTGTTFNSNNTTSSRNYVMDRNGITYEVFAVRNLSKKKFMAEEDYFQYNTIGMHTAAKAYDKVLAHAGCSFVRDAVDIRIVNNVTKGNYTYEGSNGSTGGLIDSQSDVGGWPTLKSAVAPKDSDLDGMPDAWEIANGLDPNDAKDGALYSLDSRKRWYTNVEIYANSLVEEQTKEQRADANATFTEYYPTYTTITGEVVNAGSADIYYDGEFDPTEGGTISYVTLAEGKITWPLSYSSLKSDPIVTDALAPYITATSFTMGSNLTASGSETLQGISMTKFGCKNQVNEPSDADRLLFTFTTASGDLFVPTSISFYAAKCGTNGGKYSATYSNSAFTQILAKGVEPNRNNAESGYWSHPVFDTSNALAGDGESQLEIFLYAFTNTKQEALSQVVIDGRIVSRQSTGIESVNDDASVIEILYYSLQGTRLDDNAHGIVIEVRRMSDGTTLKRKVMR